MKRLTFLFLICLCQNVFADFNTGDTFGKGSVIVQASGATVTGGGRTLNFADGLTVTAVSNAYKITSVGAGYWTANGSDIYNSNSGNVGIGTPTPQQKLDVNGNARAQAFIATGASTGYLIGNGIGIDSNNTTGSNLNPVMTLTTGYNVGIGTGNTTPLAHLHVLGNTFLSNIGGNELTFDANGSNYMALYTPSGTTDSILKFGPTTDKNTAPTTSIMAIDFDINNVGIGTDAPKQKLDVQGTIQMIGFKMATGASAGYVLTSSSVGVGTWVAAAAGGGSGTVNSGTANQAAYYASSTTAVSGTSDIRFVGSNVGIGSATPGQILDVQGTIRSTQIIDTGVTASKVVLTDSNQQFTAATNLTDTAYSTAVGANPSATVGTAAVNGSSANFIRADGAPAINLTMSPTWTGNHIFAPSSGNTTFTAGNVGVGSASPGQKLDVQGTVRTTGFTLTGNGAAAGFMLQANGSLGIGTWVAAPSGGGSGTVTSSNINTVTKFAATGTTVQGSTILFDDGTNVGIGTAGPSTLFDVNRKFNVLSGGNIGIGSITPGNVLDVQGTVRITPAASAVAALLVPSGNIGVGSATPGYSIDTNGGIRALGSGNTSLNTTSGNVGIGTTLSLNKLDVAGAVSIGTTNAGYFTAPSNGMLIQGNVGIGTVLPVKLLQIGGDAFLDRTTSAIFMREPDGTCGSCTLSNSEVWTCVSATCP